MCLVFRLARSRFILRRQVEGTRWEEEKKNNKEVAQIRSNQSAARGVWGQSQSYHVSGEAYATRRGDIRGSDATFDNQQKGNFLVADVVKKKKWKRALLVKKSLGPKLHSV